MTGMLWWTSLPAYFRTCLFVPMCFTSAPGKNYDPYFMHKVFDELRSFDFLEDTIKRSDFMLQGESVLLAESLAQRRRDAAADLRRRILVGQYRSVPIFDVCIFGAQFEKDATFLKTFSHTYLERARMRAQIAGETIEPCDYVSDVPRSTLWPHPQRTPALTVFIGGLILLAVGIIRRINIWSSIMIFYKKGLTLR